MSNTDNKSVIVAGNRGLQLQSIDDMWRFANAVAKSGMAPKSMDTAEKILVAQQMGAELGMTPMASLNGIAVINGRPSVWGDALLGLVQGSGLLESFAEWYEVGGTRCKRAPSAPADNLVAVCAVKRRGHEVVEATFSWEDAKRAKLAGKAGPWTDYPLRMLKMRARAFALRDTFSDILRGVPVAEVVQDIPPEVDVTPRPSFLPQVEAAPAPAPVEHPIAEKLRESGVTWETARAIIATGKHGDAALAWERPEDVPDEHVSGLCRAWKHVANAAAATVEVTT
jgi:hypothetical protein